MQDNKYELPPIEGELTDEDLKQVSGGNGPSNVTGLPSQNSQGNDNSQGNENQGNGSTHRLRYIPGPEVP
jgi:bacteriocin-like protein